MKTIHRIAVVVFLLVLASINASSAAVAVGLAVGSQGQTNFYLAMGDYYHVPQNQIVMVRQNRIPDEELPVVFFIAKRAHVTPEAVMRLRLARMSWMDIALRYHMGPDVFYVSMNRSAGPYGRAYGYYKNHRREEWRNMRLSDPEVVNYVNLRFLSEHYGCQPDEVAQWRSGGKRFYEINQNLRDRKYGKHENNGRWDKDRHEDRRDHDRDHRGKHHGHDRDDRNDDDHGDHDHDRH